MSAGVDAGGLTAQGLEALGEVRISAYNAGELAGEKIAGERWARESAGKLMVVAEALLELAADEDDDRRARLAILAYRALSSTPNEARVRAAMTALRGGTLGRSPADATADDCRAAVASIKAAYANEPGLEYRP